MDRSDLQQLSKEELIELILRLQHPEKTSRTSSKPPSTDKKAKARELASGRSETGA
jgi:transposase